MGNEIFKGAVWTNWATCPVTGDPIIARRPDLPLPSPLKRAWQS